MGRIARIYLLAGLAAMAGYLALPRGSLAQGWLMVAVPAAGAVAVLIGAVTHRRAAPAAWAMIAVALSLYAVATAMTYPIAVMRGRPSSLASVGMAFFLAFSFFLAGFVLIDRHHRGPRAGHDLVDVAIFALAVLLLSWTLVIGGYVALIWGERILETYLRAVGVL